MDIFIDIVNMSISASFLVIAVILFRLVFRKAPKWLNVCLWGLVALRLICPFSLESEMSLIPNSEVIPAEILSIEPNRGIESTSFEVVSNPRYSVVSDIIDNEIEITSVDSFQMYAVYLTLGWFIGIGIMLVYAFISYLRIYLKTRQRLRLRENIFICDGIGTPFIFGIIKPRIYLPSSMNEDDTAYVISHEKAHLKRRDYLWKPLGFLILTVYWFNPVMWLAYVLLCRDIELACDERVIKEMGARDKKAYSNALINCSVSRRTVTACPVAFGEVGIRKRIKVVLNYRKPAFWVIIIAVIASIILAVSFMTDPIDVSYTAPEWYYNPTYSAVGYGILSFAFDKSYDSVEAECSKGSINIYDEFYNRLEEEKTGKIIGWSPDYLTDAPEESEITIRTEKKGEKTEYNIRIIKSEKQNREDDIGIYYSVIPLDCSIKEVGWARYKLDKKDISLADSELEKAVSEAILSLNSEKKWMGECAAEGHIIFGTKRKGDITEVYLLEDYSCFGFKNGWFIEQSGHSIPCTMRFRRSDKGYELIESEYAKDGSEHVKSIKEMFPDIYVRRALNPSEKEKKSLWEQTLSYAEAYLKKIGREAKIGRYGDIEHILLTDVGVSVEVSNKLLGLKVDFDTGEIGFYERLENGVRYVYRTSYAEESNRIIYTKEKYGTGEVVEKLEVDSLTGNVIEASNTPEYVSYFDAEVTDIKKNKSYALVKPFENTKERRLSDKFHISLDVTDLPELYEGLNVRIFYNGESKKEKDGTYTVDDVSAIYLYGDMNYIGKEAATASGKQPTTRAYAVTDTTQANAEEKQETAQKLYYSYASQTDMPTLTLSPGDRSFTFYLSVFSSYLPMGTYEETDDFIILETDDGEKNYVFLKEGKNLVFSAVKSSAVPEYKYGSDKKAVPCIPDMAVFRLTDIE